MYFPFITERRFTSRSEKVRRKGGGGGGRGGSAGGRSGSSGGRGGGSTSRGGSSGSRSSSGCLISCTSSIAVGGTNRGVSTNTNGGGPPVSIPVGYPFAGRHQYGSGYPGVTGAGVSGRGFPFHFWPIAWGGAAGVGTAAYLHNSNEYGSASNTSRPGGELYTAHFTSNVRVANSTFRLVADHDTVTSLVDDIFARCSRSMASYSTKTSASAPFIATPKPENAIQYYRASSIVLTLDGYNNTVVFTNNTNAPPAPLPANVDKVLMACLNTTIGDNAPLVNANTGNRARTLDPGIPAIYLFIPISSFTRSFAVLIPLAFVLSHCCAH
uniref:Uncharacterized protein n=1 Tax=Moniliophthora roreri TaxID=221103 RepID=A0A0W0EVJ1_MONRR